MDILIVGNGFDLAHGLKTSYKDFLEYCEEQNSKRIIGLINYGTSFIDNIWLRHFITKKQELGNTWIDLEQEIYNVIQVVNNIINDMSDGNINVIFPMEFSFQKDILYFDFNKIIQYFKTTRRTYNVAKKGYQAFETNDFSSLYFYIGDYGGLINFLYDQLREFTKVFESYLRENVLLKLSNQSNYQLSLQAIGVQPQNKEVYLLSFNYTDTCEKLYKQKFNTYCNSEIKPIYIHGKVCDNEKCNLILGTHSFDNKQIPSNLNMIPVIFNVFKKHNQRHRYGTIEAYQDFLKILTDKRRVIKPVFHVIGHSLDKTDHNILKHVFLANKNAVINIYFHNEEAQERLINNITDIIGEDEVMTKVRLIYQHDKERGILIPKNSQVAQSI